MEAKYGLPLAYRRYRCKNCTHVQQIQTNHTGQCIDYCGRGPDGVEAGGKGGCSWKPSFGKPEYAVAFAGRTYRPFECIEGETCYRVTYEVRQRGAIGIFEAKLFNVSAPNDAAATEAARVAADAQGYEPRSPFKVQRIE